MSEQPVIYLDPTGIRNRAEVLASIINEWSGRHWGLRCPFDDSRLEAISRPHAPTVVRVQCTAGSLRGGRYHAFSLPVSMLDQHYTAKGYDLTGFPK